MIDLDVFSAMGATGNSFLYETGRARVVSRSNDEIKLKAKVLSGEFKDEFEFITLDGDFNLRTGRGTIDRWESRIDGDLHYRITFNDPIRLQNLTDDLKAATEDGISFNGNNFANRFDGDEGRDEILGGGGADRLKGLDGKDVLDGGKGNDLLDGGNGNDNVDGGAGNDGLIGGRGNDKLFGGAGKDLLLGGPGKDLLVGGSGADLFRFKAASESGVSTRLQDTIRDFVSGVDGIDLSAIDARPKTDKNDAFRFIGTDDFSERPGELRLNGKFLDANLDTDGKPEMRILLAGSPEVVESDFLL